MRRHGEEAEKFEEPSHLAADTSPSGIEILKNSCSQLMMLNEPSFYNLISRINFISFSSFVILPILMNRTRLANELL